MKLSLKIGPGTQWGLLAGIAIAVLVLLWVLKSPTQTKTAPLSSAPAASSPPAQQPQDMTAVTQPVVSQLPAGTVQPEAEPHDLQQTNAAPTELTAGLLETIASTNAALALDLFSTFAASATNKDQLLADFLPICAGNDPHAVVAWASTLLAQTNGEETFKSEQLASATVNALLQTTNNDLARSTVEQWCQNTNRPQLGNAVFEAVALEMATNSAADAANWLQKLPPATDRNYAMTTLAATWAQNDPQATMTWALGLSEADDRANVLERGFSQWSQQDTDSATKWLAAHVTDPAAEQMVISLVDESGLSYSKPQDAMVWAGLISDPAVRLESLQDIFLGWARQAPDTALNYIQSDPDLTPAEKQDVLKSYFSWKNLDAN